MRMMDARALSFVARLHPPSIDADAGQGNRRLRPGMLPRQEFKVRFHLSVALLHHFRPNFDGRLVQASTTQLNAANLLQQLFADRIRRRVRRAQNLLLQHRRAGRAAVNLQRDPLREKNPAHKAGNGKPVREA